ncbi:MAG: hypothetical protein HFE43_06015 [Oscillospiraceae bacterium]|jgi:hypothetical protein|nr:hypothetical protein [Oscillospiraceae bacterium]
MTFIPIVILKNSSISIYAAETHISKLSAACAKKLFLRIAINKGGPPYSWNTQRAETGSKKWRDNPYGLRHCAEDEKASLPF